MRSLTQRTLRAVKTVSQAFQNDSLNGLLQGCLTLTYNAMNYAEQNQIKNRKGMKGFYRLLRGLEPLSCYKLAVVTRACAVLKSREKSKRRDVKLRLPRPLKPMVCIITGFFISAKGRLFIPLKRDNYVDVLLNHHVEENLRGKKLRSLTIAPNSLSICYSENVEPTRVMTVYGVDRNEKNLTFGNVEAVVQLDMSEPIRIRQLTREIVASFRRNDKRVSRKLATKYWKRASHRTDQIMHAATNLIVDSAARTGAALALENLK